MNPRNITSIIILLISSLIIPASAIAISTSYYSTNSVLSGGKWVRVRVERTGMQEISFSDLRAAGFSDPSKVVVFGYGGIGDRLGVLSNDNRYLDDLTQTYSKVYSDKLVFYGESGLKYEWSGTSMVIPFENFDSNAGYYFLTDSHSRINKTAVPFDPSARVSTHPEAPRTVVAKHPMETNHANAGARLHSRNLMNDDNDFSDKIITFRLPDYYEGTDVCLSLQVIAGGSEYPRVTIKTSTSSKILNSSAFDKAYCQASCYFHNDKTDRYNQTDGSAEIDVTLTPTASSGVTLLAYESMLAGYYVHPRLKETSNIVLQYFAVKNDTRILLEEESESAEAWVVSNKQECKPLTIHTDPNDGKRYFGADMAYNSPSTPYRVVLFDPARELNKPVVVGEVPNQNIHAEKTPAMIIIASPKLTDQAKRLADAHYEHDGSKVLVLTPQQVYNEFSSGTPSVNAYRRMAKMFYDRDQSHTQFRHLMLMGPAVYDSRLIQPAFSSMDSEQMVLTFPTRDQTLQPSHSASFSSDLFIGLLDDNKGFNNHGSTDANCPIRIAVGRLPAVTEAEAAAYVNKAIRYLKGDYNYGSFNRAILICDDGDQDSHAIQAQNIASLIEQNSPSTTVSRIYDGIYPWQNGIATNATKALYAALKEGASYLCYLGHGRPDCITKEAIISKSTISSNEYSCQPVMFFATCDVFGFDRRDDNFCETLLYKDNGGAVALIASGRTVFQEYNQMLNLAFANMLFKPENRIGLTYGQIFQKAVNESYKSSDIQLLQNTLCYNFGGDPALPVYYPDSDIRFTKINDADVTDEESETPYILIAGTTNRIQCAVCKDGVTETSFNGWADIALYESPDIATNLYQDNAPENDRNLTEVYRDETLILSRRVRVRSGIIDESLFIPAPRRSDERNRITVAAISDDCSSRAISFRKDISVSDIASLEYADIDAPVIDGIYVDNPGFQNGDIVPSSATLHIGIQAEPSGLVLFNSSVGISPRITLDGKKSYYDLANYATVLEDGSVTIDYPLRNIEDGDHTLRFNINDYAGNVATGEINFTVVNSDATAKLCINETIVRTEAVFTIDHTFPDEEPEGHIVIETSDGTPAFACPGIHFPFTWNLKDNDGNALPDGTYRAKAFLNTAHRYASTAHIQFHILNLVPESETQGNIRGQK